MSVWVLRVGWLLLPLLVGPVLGPALDDRLPAVRTLATVGAWAVWSVVLVASLVPRASSLTVVRAGAPAALVAAAWAAGPGSTDGTGAGPILAVVAGATMLAVALAPATSDAFVNGSAYGTERRFALRCPPLLAGLATATWMAVATGAGAGPLLLAAERWVAGTAATVVGAVVAGAGLRSLHGLSRRWLVLVPSGVVVHDPVARPDSVMAPRPLITGLGPAPAATDALDLTLGAPGLALELTTSEPLPVTVRRGRGLGTVEATRILVTPLRPAAVLAEAAERRIPVAPPPPPG